MLSNRAREEALCAMLRASGHSDIWAEPAEPYGILLIHNSVAVGVWSYFEGRFRFRNLASYEPVAVADDAAEAVIRSQHLVAAFHK